MSVSLLQPVISFGPIAEEAEERNVDYSHKGLTCSDLSKLAVDLMGRTVTGLNLNHNALGDAGCAVVAQILLGSRTINMLSMEDNVIHPPGAESLSRALVANRTLKVLSLPANYLGPVGVGSIAQAAALSCITELDLRENYLTERGAAVLAKAVQGRFLSLLRLNLGNNFLSSEGAGEILSSLPQSLTHLDLSENLIDRDALGAITAAVTSQSPRLATLSLERNRLGAEEMTAIVTAGGQATSPIDEIRMSYPATDTQAMKTIVLGLQIARRVRVKGSAFIFRPPKSAERKKDKAVFMS